MHGAEVQGYLGHICRGVAGRLQESENDCDVTLCPPPANGLPTKLAENPVDKGKVKKIIARMKAEAVVASIKHQFRCLRCSRP